MTNIIRTRKLFYSKLKCEDCKESLRELIYQGDEINYSTEKVGKVLGYQCDKCHKAWKIIQI